MSKGDKKQKKNTKSCGSNKGAMLVFALSTLGSRAISAVALVAIALGFCSINKEAKVFNQCVEEIRDSGKSASAAVRFCNGGS